MEIAFAGGAFAKIAGDNAGWGVGALEGLEFQGIGSAGGLRDLGC